MKKILCVVLALIMGLSMVACSTGDDSEGGSGYKSEIIYCQGSDLTTLDPSFSSQERAYGFYVQMFDTLVKYDTDLNLLPGLATEWSWSEDNKDLSMTLREGVTFHDGSAFTGEDVAYTMDVNDEYGKFGGTYESTEVVDDTHVIIHLNAPNPAVIYTLTCPDMSILPSDVHSADPEAFKFAPVGTGPYKFDSYEEGNYYTAVRYDGYWGEAPKTEKITLKIVPEASQRTILLQTGEVDVAYEIPLSDIDMLTATGDYEILTCPSMKNVFLEFNCSSEGPVGNSLVRQAIACAIDKNVIIDNLLYGYGTVADCFIPETAHDYMDTTANTYNLDQAKQYLKEAGYEDGFSFTLWVNTNQTYQEIASVIADQLAQLNITVNIVSQDDNTSFALVEARDPSYEAILDFWQTCSGHADYSFRGALLSDAIANFSLYNNPDYDATYYEYAATPEGAERDALLEQLYGYLTKDTPSVVLYNEVKYVAVRSDLEGLELSQIGAHYYGNAYIPE